MLDNAIKNNPVRRELYNQPLLEIFPILLKNLVKNRTQKDPAFLSKNPSLDALFNGLSQKYAQPGQTLLDVDDKVLGAGTDVMGLNDLAAAYMKEFSGIYDWVFAKDKQNGIGSFEDYLVLNPSTNLRLIHEKRLEALEAMAQKYNGTVNNFDTLHGGVEGEKVALVGSLDGKNKFYPKSIRNIVAHVTLTATTKGDEAPSIYQPLLKFPRNTNNPGDPRYSRHRNVTSWAQEMLFFNTRSLMWLYEHGEYYGKGIIDLKQYYKKVTTRIYRNEMIDGKSYTLPGAVPSNAMSHDMYEGMYGGVEVITHLDMFEGSSDTYLVDLLANKRWRIGDVSFLLRQYFNYRLDPPQRKRVEFILRGVVSEIAFNLFLGAAYIGTLGGLIAAGFNIAWFVNLGFLQSIFWGWAMFGTVMFGLIGISKLLGPLSGVIKDEGLDTPFNHFVDLFSNLGRSIYKVFIFFENIFRSLFGKTPPAANTTLLPSALGDLKNALFSLVGIIKSPFILLWKVFIVPMFVAPGKEGVSQWKQGLKTEALKSFIIGMPRAVFRLPWKLFARPIIETFVSTITLMNNLVFNPFSSAYALYVQLQKKEIKWISRAAGEVMVSETAKGRAVNLLRFWKKEGWEELGRIFQVYWNMYPSAFFGVLIFSLTIIFIPAFTFLPVSAFQWGILPIAFGSFLGGPLLIWYTSKVPQKIKTADIAVTSAFLITLASFVIMLLPCIAPGLGILSFITSLIPHTIGLSHPTIFMVVGLGSLFVLMPLFNTIGSFIDRLIVSHKSKAKEQQVPYSVVGNSVFAGVTILLAQFHIPVLSVGAAVAGAIYGTMLLVALVARAFVSSRFHEDSAMKDQLINDLEARGASDVRFDDGNLPALTFASTNRKTRVVTVKRWIIAQSNSAIFNFFRLFLVRMIVTHEDARLKGFGHLRTYLSDILNVPFAFLAGTTQKAAVIGGRRFKFSLSVILRNIAVAGFSLFLASNAVSSLMPQPTTLPLTPQNTITRQVPQQITPRLPEISVSKTVKTSASKSLIAKFRELIASYRNNVILSGIHGNSSEFTNGNAVSRTQEINASIDDIWDALSAEGRLDSFITKRGTSDDAVTIGKALLLIQLTDPDSYNLLKAKDTHFFLDPNLPGLGATEGSRWRGVMGMPIIHMNKTYHNSTFGLAVTIDHESEHVRKLPTNVFGVFTKFNPLALVRNFLFADIPVEEIDAYTRQTAYVGTFGIVPEKGRFFSDETKMAFSYQSEKWTIILINFFVSFFWLTPIAILSRLFKRSVTRRQENKRVFNRYNKDGFIQQGEESWKEFQARESEIRKNDITNFDYNNLMSLGGEIVALSHLPTPDKEALKKRIETLRIFGFDSIIKGSDDFMFGYYNANDNSLFVAENELASMPVTLRLEYLFHEIACPILGHNEAILAQQRIFPANYPDREMILSQDKEKPYKGRLGEYLRNRIDTAVASAKASPAQEPVKMAQQFFNVITRPLHSFSTISKTLLEKLLPGTHAWLLQKYPALYGKASIGIYTNLDIADMKQEMSLNSSGMPALVIADEPAIDVNVFSESDRKAATIIVDNKKMTVTVSQIRHKTSGESLILLSVDAASDRELLGRASRQIVRELVEGKPEFMAGINSLLDSKLSTITPAVIRTNDTAAFEQFTKKSWLDMFSGKTFTRTLQSMVYEFNASSSIDKKLSITAPVLSLFDVVTTRTPEEKSLFETAYPHYYKGDDSIASWQTTGSRTDQVHSYIANTLAPVSSIKTTVAGRLAKEERISNVFGVPKRWVTIPGTGLSAKSSENAGSNRTLTALPDSFDLFSRAGIDTIMLKNIFKSAGVIDESIIDWKWVAQEVFGLNARETTELLSQPDKVAATLYSRMSAADKKTITGEDAFTQWAAKQLLTAMVKKVTDQGGNVLIDYPFTGAAKDTVLADIGFLTQTAKVSGLRISGTVSDLSFINNITSLVRASNPRALIVSKGIDGILTRNLGIMPEEDLQEATLRGGLRENKVVTVKLADLRTMPQDEALRLLSGLTADNINVEMDEVPLFVENAKSFDFFDLMQQLARALEPKTEEGYFTEGYESWSRYEKAGSIISGSAARELAILQTFTVRNSDGTTTTLRASGLNIILAVWQHIKLTGNAIFAQTRGEELFTTLFAILGKAGIKGEFKAYIDQLHTQFANPATDAATKAKLIAQVAGSIQGLLENTGYQQYLASNGSEFGTRYENTSKKLLVKINALFGYDDNGIIPAMGSAALFGLARGLSRIKRTEEAKNVLATAIASLRSEIESELAKPQDQVAREVAATEGAERDLSIEQLILSYMALQQAQELDRSNREFASLQARIREAITTRAALKKSWCVSDLLLVPSGILTTSQNEAILRSIEAKEIDGAKILTPYGIYVDGALSPLWLTRFVVAKKTVLEQKEGKISTETALRELHFWMGNLAACAAVTGTVPSSFNRSSFAPATSQTDPETIAEMLLVLDIINAEAKGMMKLENNRLPIINVKAMNAVLASL